MALFDALRSGNAVTAMSRNGWDYSPIPVPRVSVGRADISGLFGPAVTLESALGVPAFARSLSLICDIAAGFPLRAWGDSQPQLLRGQGIAKMGTDTALISGTVQDLVCYGKAAWLVRDNSARRVRADQLVDSGEFEIFAERVWSVAGYERLPGDLVVFDTGGDGVLATGWQTLTTAMMLEAAAQTIAESPLPNVVLKSNGIDLTRDEALELLEQWARSRRSRSTAYLPGTVDAQPLGFSSVEMQLVEARNHAAIEVSRLMGLAAYWVDAGVSGSSVTYANREDLNQALLDQAVMPRLRVIEQTLSRYLGSRVVFDTAAFLRANAAARATVLNAYVASGVITTGEARALEPMIDEGDAPA